LADLAEDEQQAAAWMPHYTLRELRDDLRAFARRALGEHDLNAQLFATEADRAVRLLDVLMADYDVVVMNPPFGYPLPGTKKPIDTLYKDWCSNLLCAFYIRALSLLGESGYIGMVSDKTFAVKKTYAPFRDRYFLTPATLLAFLDLGWDVLDDANVEVCSFISVPDRPVSRPVFIDLQEFREKQKSLEGTLASGNSKFYTPEISDLRRFPFGAFGYRAPESILRAFARFEKLDGTVAYCPSGGLDAPARQYYRRFWEVPNTKIGPRSDYAPFWNGGSRFSPYYEDSTEVLRWHGDGSIVAADPRSNIRIRDHYFRPGVAWGKRGHILDVCWLNDSVFSKEGQQIFPYDESHIWPLIAFLNSEVARYSINLFCGQHKYGGYVGQLPLSKGLLRTPQELTYRAKHAHDLKAAWDTGNEICTCFTQPWLLQLAQPESDSFARGLGCVVRLLGDETRKTALHHQPITVEALLATARAIEDAADARLQRLQAEIDGTIYDLYEISHEDRALIERELADCPPLVIWPEMQHKSDRAKREEHVKRFFSYYVRQAVREDEDGIVPLAGRAGREPYLMDRVRAKLEQAFGPATAYDLEQEAAEYIGRDVETWMHTYFFHGFHTDVHKKRPVLWHLTSDKKTFAVMLDYHRLDRDTLPKVRSQYLWPQIESVRTRLTAARASEAVATIADLEEELEDLKAFEGRLESVIQGTVQVRLPKWANGPYRNGEPPYDPDLNDGVKLNLLPIQKAGLLPVKRVV
jgi:hypothetical protein